MEVTEEQEEEEDQAVEEMDNLQPYHGVRIVTVSRNVEWQVADKTTDYRLLKLSKQLSKMQPTGRRFYGVSVRNTYWHYHRDESWNFESKLWCYTGK